MVSRLVETMIILTTIGSLLCLAGASQSMTIPSGSAVVMAPPSYDTVSAATSFSSSLTYQNLGATGTNGIRITNITEPAQILTVTSQIFGAFSYAGQTSSSVNYDLTPYVLNTYSNTASLKGSNPAVTTQVALFYTGDNPTSWITSTNPLSGTVIGYQAPTSISATTESFTFTSSNQLITLATPLYNITGIRISGRALPGPMSIKVTANAGKLGPITMASLVSTGPAVYYFSGHLWDALSQASAGNVIYNQQNGGPTTKFSLYASGLPLTNKTEPGQYFTYSMREVASTTNSQAQDMLAFGIVNSTGGVSQQTQFEVDYSVAPYVWTSGTPNYISYTDVAGDTPISVPVGFTTQRGSEVSKISPYTDTFLMSKTVSISSCGSLFMSTVSYSAHMTQTCTWSGGSISIYAAGGDSGYAGYSIVSPLADTVVASGHTNARCLTLMQTVLLPAQTYYVTLNTGAGGGSCGAAVLDTS